MNSKTSVVLIATVLCWSVPARADDATQLRSVINDTWTQLAELKWKQEEARQRYLIWQDQSRSDIIRNWERLLPLMTPQERIETKRRLQRNGWIN